MPQVKSRGGCQFRHENLLRNTVLSLLNPRIAHEFQHDSAPNNPDYQNTRLFALILSPVSPNFDALTGAGLRFPKSAALHSGPARFGKSGRWTIVRASKWIKTKRACATLWSTLYKMHQFKTRFSTSGDLRMADLTFYNKLSSSEMRELEVQVIADQIDKIFTKGRGAKYEEGIHISLFLGVGSSIHYHWMNLSQFH